MSSNEPPDRSGEHGKNCLCHQGDTRGDGSCRLLEFRSHKYDDVLGEPSPGQFDPGAHRGLGLGASARGPVDAVPPGSSTSDPQPRRVLHIALREVVQRVVDGKHLDDWRRIAIPVVHVDFGLTACLVWHRPDGVIAGMPWDRVAEWHSDPVDEKPYSPMPPMPSATG